MSSQNKDIPGNIKDTPGNIKGPCDKVGATAASAKQLIESQLPDSVDDAIRKIKMIAAERVRQKATAARVAIAAGLNGPPQNSASGLKVTDQDINTLISTAANLSVGTVGAAKNEEGHKFDTKDEASHKKILGPQGNSHQSVPPNDIKPSSAQTQGPLTGSKLGVLTAPKSRPKSSEPKLPQTEDGFSPQPWVKRRYTISQLLLLGEIVPYVICSRDRFNIQIFAYDIIHIPGLGNESTGNPVVDHQILTLNLRTELIGFQFFTTYGYRYIDRFKSSDHTLYVKGLWVEVRGSAGLRDHGGYRNAYRPKQYDVCVREGLIKEDQEAEGMSSTTAAHHFVASPYRGRGSRGGSRGSGGYRGGSSRGGHRSIFSSASTEQPFWKENTIALPNTYAYNGLQTPMFSNGTPGVPFKEVGIPPGFPTNYSGFQPARFDLERGAEAGTAHNSPSSRAGIQPARFDFEKKRAEFTNKWGDIYGYAVQDQVEKPVEKPKGLEGASTTQEQQIQYIQYMIQYPLAPVLSTTQAAGFFMSTAELARGQSPPFKEIMDMN
ncbi:hypothetical protein DRE_05254 [Drechslerella stenobrocha 248]|uniref:Uncharacterized protein n=1 Tax=Drechslerella stenobrocha 248 TaxID=1043628 RepID=W7I0F1_9PEZI|nr:hypothetical protein DRE_05254 [Drechslerella stenobrocha 248]